MSHVTDQLSTALADRYRIERELGQGGMALVYLATDVKHDRKVALKILRPELAAVIGAERFLNEIKVTANLQHPHILPLHDSGEAGSFLYYVMPYVEGDTLRDKLDHEKQLGVEDAIEITRSVASALDYAHRQGVIHRDIKPENILVHDGQALVADFGIALAISHAGGNRLTETGLSIGTPHYMSPEQAMGDRELDARSDVYSLGAMLYEMLAGDPPYTGSTAQAIVAKVITEKAPPITQHRDTVPGHVAAAITKALAKLPADRFKSAAEFAEALGDFRFTLPAASVDTAGVSAVPRVRRSALTAVSALTALTALFAAWGWLRNTPEATGVVRFSTALPTNLKPSLGVYQALAVSPDGRLFVYVGPGETEGSRRLYARDVDQLTPAPLTGSDSAMGPTFSPDGEWIAFSAGGRLKKIPAGGGPAITLADSVPPFVQSAAWLDDGTIVFARGNEYALARVSANGGIADVVLRPDSSSGGFAVPTPLPAGRGALFNWCQNQNCDRTALGVLDLKRDTAWVLVEDATAGWYLPTGHVAFAQSNGAVFAQAFDLGRLALSGSPVPLLEGVRLQGGVVPQLAVGGSALVYLSGDGSVQNELVLVERDGTERPLTDQLGDYQDPVFSPDGRRLAFERHDGNGNGHIWIYDLQSATMARLTREGHDARPSWTPSGTGLLFMSSSQGGWKAFITRADGSEVPHLLIDQSYFVRTTTLSPDGRTIVFNSENDGEVGFALYAVGIEGGTPQRVVQTGAREWAPALSPDGRWLAYVSDESGQPEVYVRAFPNPGGRWAVSVGGGQEPAWAPSGRELFYRNRDGFHAAQLEFQPTVRVPSRQLLFNDRSYMPRPTGIGYDVHPDGRRFIFVKNQSTGSDPVVVVNWMDEVRARVGKSR